MRSWFIKLKARLFPDVMIVEGNDVIGYLARYPDEKDAVWASSRDAAVDGCELGRLYESFGKNRHR